MYPTIILVRVPSYTDRCSVPGSATDLCLSHYAHIASGAQPRPTSPLRPNPGPHRLWGPTQPSNQLVHAGTAKKLKRPELKADCLPNISTAPARLRFFQAFSSVVRQMPQYNLTFKHLMSTIVDVPHR